MLSRQKINEMQEQLEEVGNLLIFLSDHLHGRMGPLALDQMESEGRKCFEILGKKYTGKLPKGASRA
jgi:hypothetical protein